MKKVLALILVLAMVLSFAACAKKEPKKETWPNKQVTLYSGYQAGSLTDTNIRTLADFIQQKTGASVEVVIDDVGGGANLAVKLTQAEADGYTLMNIGANTIYNYYAGTWKVNPADTSKFKVVASCIQPLPASGCMVLTQGDAPFNNYAEFEAYVKANPGTITAASMPGKVMDVKLKSFLIQTGLAEYVHWVSTDSKSGNVALLSGDINLVMADEASAYKNFLSDPANNVKCLINLRPDNDFSYYDPATPGLDVIKAQDTLENVFGKEKAQQINVPNTSVWCVPAGTPDDVCKQIAEVMDALDKEVDDPKSDSDFYDRVHANGGTTKYWVLSAEEIAAEWARLDPIIQKIAEMNKNLK